jgi:hypothetical protein
VQLDLLLARMLLLIYMLFLGFWWILLILDLFLIIILNRCITLIHLTHSKSLFIQSVLALVMVGLLLLSFDESGFMGVVSSVEFTLI